MSGPHGTPIQRKVQVVFSPILDSPQGLHSHEFPLKRRKVATTFINEGQFTPNGSFEVGQKTMATNIEIHDVVKYVVDLANSKFDVPT